MREAAADRRGRRRALRARDRRAARASPRRTASRLRRRRPARVRWRGTIRCSRARSASPARRRPTRLRATPTSCSASARGCRTSPPARIRCSRRRALVSVNVNRFDAQQVARRRRCARDARAALACAVERAGRMARRRRVDAPRASETANAWRDDVARITGAARRRSCPYEGDVIGAVQRSAADSPAHDIVVCAAGTLPGRAAQAVAHRDAGRLPHGVRLLVHGLRDRRRPRREDGAARARGRS